MANCKITPKLLEMTHYDKLIDSITEQLYYFWSSNTSTWNEEEAKQKAHKILTIVEEFQSKRTNVMRWRASD
jgi:predicted RNase H-like nuclease (RuvC/YqgF family)